LVQGAALSWTRLASLARHLPCGSVLVERTVDIVTNARLKETQHALEACQCHGYGHVTGSPHHC
jgi:hypothetical protein